MPLAPPPFDSQVFDTLKEYVITVKAYAKSESYTIITDYRSNKQNNKYYRYDLAYNKGKNKIIVRSIGIQPSTRSIKEEYPF